MRVPSHIKRSLSVPPAGGLEEQFQLLKTPSHTELRLCVPRRSELPACWKGSGGGGGGGGSGGGGGGGGVRWS